MRAPRTPAVDVDHPAELARAVDAHRQSQRGLEDALARQRETRAVADDLRRHRVANRFAERIAQSFRE